MDLPRSALVVVASILHLVTCTRCLHFLLCCLTVSTYIPLNVPACVPALPALPLLLLPACLLCACFPACLPAWLPVCLSTSAEPPSTTIHCLCSHTNSSPCRPPTSFTWPLPTMHHCSPSPDPGLTHFLSCHVLQHSLDLFFIHQLNACLSPFPCCSGGGVPIC